MSDLIKTTVLKPHMGLDGVITMVGQEIEVDEQRHKALTKKGFVSSEAGNTESVAQKAPKEAITNADFEGKRERISGSGDTAPKEAKPVSKGAASTKRKAKSA